jgi:hypothetical protein
MGTCQRIANCLATYNNLARELPIPCGFLYINLPGIAITSDTFARELPHSQRKGQPFYNTSEEMKS